ncbi:hypothetical protein LguiA_020967 [Lonicera macranthoides]
MGMSNFHLFPSGNTPNSMESKFLPRPTSQFQETDAEKKAEEFEILVSSLKIKIPSLAEFKDDNDDDQEEKDGLRTPKSLDQEIPLNCPPAPRKPKSMPLNIRKRRNLIDLSKEIDSLLTPVLLADRNGKIKKKLKDGGEVEEKDKYGVIFGDLNDNDTSKEDPNCFDSSIWNDISLLEEIDFTAIQLEATSKVIYPDVDEQAMKIEPHSQIQMKSDDLNLDGDEGKNLIDGEPNNPSCASSEVIKDPYRHSGGYQAWQKFMFEILELIPSSDVIKVPCSMVPS